ncbi:hypothetical protein EJB05_32546 [Eragrostis curvula]|uniref:RRM domain-containing protein n=1 Tax=Eragrostis curvula TaxID=38414 RepID=A0A5J9UH41_9POAL|nr:hypothetical protein EJB05_32546 [Eragrostis curvula]
MSAPTSREKCPLCLEEMDLTDKELKPCKCGYEGLCADKLNLQKEQNKSHKPKSSNIQSAVAEEPKDPNNVRVIQRKLVYIVGMPSELASPRVVLKQKNFLGQYGKIESIVIDNVGANQQIPDSGRVYVTFSKEEEAARCIQAINGYILDGRTLKATFGVTRYCHIWLSNRPCFKQNCSYVHYKAAPEDICSRDDVSVFCSRLQQLMGMDMKGIQHRSGSTLPPPGHCNSRATVCSETSKDFCSSGDRLLPSGAAKNPDLLPAISRDLCLSSGSQKGNINEQLTSNNNKASAQSGNGTSNSKQMTSAENGTSDISLQKPQYVSVVSQGQGGSGRRFTVLSRQTASTDTWSKATAQIGNGTSTSTKPTFTKNEQSDSITIPRSQNVNIVSQKPEQSSHLLASKSVESHAQEEKKNESSDISAKLALGNQKQLLKNTVSNSSTAVHTMSGKPMLSNVSTSDVKSQTSARPCYLSGSNGKLASQNQLQLGNQQNAPVSNTSNTGLAKASLGRNILNSQAPSTDSKCQNSAQGAPHCLFNREITRPANQSSDGIPLSKPVSVVSSTDLAAPDGKGRKKQVSCPPGFEKLQHSSDSGKFVSLCSSTHSELCSTTDALVQDSCGITDEPHIISMVSHCLDDGDVTQDKNVSISSPLSSTDTIWRRAQFPGTYSGLSNHAQVSPYPSGFLQWAPPSVSCTSYQQPSYLDGSTSSYMSTGGYDAFRQGTASGMATSVAGTLLQQPPMPSHGHGWTHGNADSGMNCPQVDISYPRGYTLF